MGTTLLTPAQWAHTEFGSARLGDRRRTKRLVKMGTRFAEHPGGALPQAFPEWKDLKAVYRFLSQPGLGWEAIQGPHWERTYASCCQPGEYLLIEDTSELDYSSHPATEELGPIGNGRGRGLLLHSNLVERVSGWDAEQRPVGTLVGLLDQKCWRRQGPPKRGRETWRQRVSRPRESQHWAAVLERVGGPPAHSRWIQIMDREADFYEPIERCQRHGVDFIIRGYRDRALVDRDEHLKEAMGQAPVMGQMIIELRARPGQPARQAQVEVRSMAVRLKGPERRGGARPELHVNVVEVRELAPPSGVEPLYWLLLTSLPCTTRQEVQRVVGRYTARWLVEEYHKALKTGTKVEESQLEKAYRLESLIAVMAIVAVRLLNMKLLARACPDQAVDRRSLGPEALRILEAKFGKPKPGWTHQSVAFALARLGGFLARRHDGWPGWQTIWRGWHRLMWMCEALELSKLSAKKCG
jgi:hypothetical protein